MNYTMRRMLGGYIENLGCGSTLLLRGTWRAYE